MESRMKQNGKRERTEKGEEVKEVSQNELEEEVVGGAKWRGREWEEDADWLIYSHLFTYL